jgi:hypothetical protein
MGKGYPRQLRDIPQHDKLLKENHEILKKKNLVCMNVGLVGWQIEIQSSPASLSKSMVSACRTTVS